MIRGSRLSPQTVAQLERSRKEGATETDVSKQRQNFVNLVGMEMIAIPDGEFNMGSPASENSRKVDESQHRVTVRRNMYFAKHETTVAQFR